MIFFLAYNRRLQSNGLSPRNQFCSKLKKAKSANDVDEPPVKTSEEPEDITEKYLIGARSAIAEDGKEGLIR